MHRQIENVDKQNPGFISDDLPALELLVLNSQCNAAIIPETFYPSGYGIALPKGTPYKPFFDKK